MKLLPAALVLALGAAARAEVVRIEILAREPFAGGAPFGVVGPYVRLTGRLFLEVDPNDPANGRVCDLKLAPRNARGRVELWTDFCLLMPADPARGNGRLFYDVNNRGNKLALGAFNNRGGNAADDAGNGFLMRLGYAVLWCGWNGDVRPGDGRLQIGLPVARNPDGTPITGRLYAEITVNAPAAAQPFAWGNTDPYPADSDAATLAVRPTRAEPAVALPAGAWSFSADRKQLQLKDGFKPGLLYELVYGARDPRVTGLGFAAVRDAVSFFRHAPAPDNPLAGSVRFAYVFGISQSARFIHHFLHDGFNGDERGRIVFDGALPHVGGGGKGLFNHRFAQTTRHGSPHEDHLYPADFFPFNTVPQKDPLTGREGDSLGRSRRHLPRILFTMTSSEYWARAASLLHTDVEGLRDAPLDPNVRLYFFTGNQHGVSGSTDRGIYVNAGNPLDHRPLLRASLVALDRWVSQGREPPASRYPRIDDGTLVTAEAWRARFPRIPGAAVAVEPFAPPRLDPGPRWESEGIADVVPPKAGPPYRTLVPAVDADGNERAGVRLPDVAVPLAAYAGWNVRGEAAGAAGMLGRWSGSSFPFARTAEERAASGDPRPSVRERHPTREVYLGRVTEAALALRDEGFLLDEDVVEILKAAAKRDLW